MSQIHKGGSGGSPAVVEITFTTDVTSPAVTSSDVITFQGRSVADNNQYGIETVGSSGGTNLYVKLTNRQYATATTTDASVTLLTTLTLDAVAGTYSINVDINAINTTDSKSASRILHYCVKTDGATATAVSSIKADRYADSGMENLLMPTAPFVSGNTVPIYVAGIAGKTINWSVLVTYDKI